MLEAFSYVVRMFSGVISDRMASRKAAITAGFMMGAAAKFGMSFCTTTISLFMTKAIDRLGNGVQVIGESTPTFAAWCAVSAQWAWPFATACCHCVHLAEVNNVVLGLSHKYCWGVEIDT